MSQSTGVDCVGEDEGLVKIMFSGITFVAHLAVQAVVHMDLLNMAITIKLACKSPLTAVTVVMFCAENNTMLFYKF